MVLVQALVTALLSGLFSAFVLFALNEERDRLEQKLQHNRQTHKAVSEWCDAFVARYFLAYELVKDDANLPEVLRHGQDLQRGVESLAADADWLVSVYSPELVPKLNDLRLKMVPAVESFGEIARRRVQGQAWDPRPLDKLKDELIAVVAAKSAILAEIAAVGRQIANRPLIYRRLKRSSRPKP